MVEQAPEWMVHVTGLKLPAPVDTKLTPPVGARVAVPETSETLAVQLSGVFTVAKALAQDSDREVARALTCKVKGAADDEEWSGSPPYLPPIC
jgi:hypothetical protein